MIQDAQGWCTGMTQRDGMGREVGGEFRMGNTCTTMEDSSQCMAKPIQYYKVNDRMWSTGEGNGKPLQYSCLENPMNSMRRQNDRILKGELPRSIGTQYATGDQWRNNSRKNERMEPNQKQYPVVDVTGDRRKFQCC